MNKEQPICAEAVGGLLETFSVTNLKRLRTFCSLQLYCNSAITQWNENEHRCQMGSATRRLMLTTSQPSCNDLISCHFPKLKEQQNKNKTAPVAVNLFLHWLGFNSLFTVAQSGQARRVHELRQQSCDSPRASVILACRVEAAYTYSIDQDL